MNIQLHPKKFFTANLLLILLLLLANIAGRISKFYFDHDHMFGLVPLFDFNTENNIPTFYSAVALMFSAVLLLFIGLSHKKSNEPYISWLGLSFIFAFLSIDEISVIHEKLINPTRELLSTSAMSLHAWVIPYGIAAILIAAIFSRFLLNLPNRYKRLFILSGAIFIGGAVGMEILGGLQIDHNGWDNMLYSALYTIEETLEMLGIALFIYSLLSYISTELGPVKITLSESFETPAESRP